jgi:uncharacterized membrane protein
MKNQTESVFSTKEALRFGWEKTKANLKPFLVLGVAGTFFALLQRALTSETPQAALPTVMSLFIQVLQVALTLFYVRAALNIHDGQSFDPLKPEISLSEFFSFLLASVIYWLVVAIGFVLLIVPGVIWALKFGYCGFLVADKKFDPFDALNESSRLTNGVKGQLFGFAVIVCLVNLVGALALGVGLVVTIPATVIAAAHVLRRLQARAARTAAAQSLSAVPTPCLPVGQH